MFVIVTDITALWPGRDDSRGVQVTLASWRYTVLAAATGLQTIKNGPGTYGGYRVLAAAGAGTLDFYDNPGAAAGQQIERPGLTIAAAADLILPTGIDFSTGLTVNKSGVAPTAGLVIVLWK